MKITIVIVGKIKEKYLTAGIQEYLKRLTPHCSTRLRLCDSHRWNTVTLGGDVLDEELKRVVGRSYD
ncbi:23S rRNA (pseudouridine(1915)-N(3))-methyltransferase RlmH [Methylomusa anaerophila]|uniref:rRNA large subunit methyltransferase n=1 Tax=Methylomusa anaerophila TaxID=1930071 RepID=A0A348AGM7_9FIRM|nr:rRNA large subunit methyltransferase [Methylomusa anaerophila]